MGLGGEGGGRGTPLSKRTSLFIYTKRKANKHVGQATIFETCFEDEEIINIST